MQPDEIAEKYDQAIALSSQGKFNESIELLVPLILDEIEDKELLANMSYLMGMDHWRVGLYNESITYFQKALPLMKELRLNKKLPSILNAVGLIYRKSGSFRDALVQFLEGLFYAFQMDDKHSMVAITSNIAMVMLEMDDWERSNKGYDTAFELCRDLPDSQEFNTIRCQILLNKCILLYTHKQIREDGVIALLAQIQEILDSATGVGLSRSLIEIFIAHSYIQIQKYELAYDLLKDKELPDTKIINVSNTIGLVDLGIIHKALFHDEALFMKYMDKAFKIAEEGDMFQVILSIHQELEKHYTQKGNTNLAEFHRTKLESLKEENSKSQDVGYLRSIVEANIDAVESKSKLKNKIEDKILSEHDFLINSYSYQYHKINYQVPLRDIVFVEVQKNYLLIYTVANADITQFEMTQIYKVRKPLKEFISEIDTAAPYFVRIHGSFIVNLYWISKFPQKNLSRLSIGDKELPISESYRSDFRDQINVFMSSFPQANI